MANFWQDIFYGLRILARKPAFTVLAVLTLALGIGANTAIFTVVDAVLLRPLPFRDPDKLVQLYQTESAPGHYPLTGQDFLDFRAQNRTFQDMAVYSYGRSFNVSAAGSGEPERAQAVEVEANFFDLLGVAPLYGRSFLNGEDQAGRNHVALLSYFFWQQNFAGQRSAINSSLTMDGERYTVVGVMPAWYRLPGGADLWVPIDMSPTSLGGRGSHHLRAIGRVKTGVSLAQAQSDLKSIGDGLAKQFPDSNGNETAGFVALRQQIIGDSASQLWIVFGAAGLVLLIACVNVAHLLLARATGRRREIAMRAALGAARSRLVRQLLTESVMLSLVGALLGVAVAFACVRLLGNLTVTPFPRPNPIAVNLTVLFFTLAVSVTVGILFGLAPALQTSHVNLVEELKSSSEHTASISGRGRFLRDVLVVAEIALSLALLSGAALLLRTFANLRAVDIGVNTTSLLTAQVLLPPSRYSPYDQQVSFYEQLASALSREPGVRAAAVSSELPLQGGSNGYVRIDGRDESFSQGELVEWTYVTPDYWRAMGIPFEAGRALNDADLAATADLVRKWRALPEHAPPPAGEVPAVISEIMARRFWPNQQALGRMFHASGTPMRVVGVAANVKLWSLRQTPIPQAYLPLSWAFGTRTYPMDLVVRGTSQPEQLASAVRAAVHSLDPGLAVFHVASMKDILSETMTNDTDQAFLLGVFAALALLLAGVGTYGVMSYLVTQRTSEIGIRMALGANRGRVLWMVLRKGLLLAAAGIALGVAGALGTSSLLRSALFGVTPTDVSSLLAVSATMVVVALAACVLPAWRAMSVEPIVALRYE